MARILISMPDKFLESIDKLADTEQRTKVNLCARHSEITSKRQ